jgi:TFIIF-interacting CTD phosphatase-like protein
MHPECAIPITSWYTEKDDTELYLLTPILECLAEVDDVRVYLKVIVKEDRVLFNKAAEVLQGGRAVNDR